ncbi:hypothetical protein PLESTB_000254000 [Pleodorina starrii]|uniref:Uncharacterized protein n=1 Tax=Pleodorina starrii TaxID=330485 RepID=A0A9W6BCD5_9CHLO|nr:hypothetical protein PLESTM_000471000 [Pleodorina starrii]GLC49547.1 hypothetical protein PLESTB_000254000 [Pleodorina starrii]
MEQRITDLEATLVTARADQTAAETAKPAAEDRAENAEEMAKQLELVVDQAGPSTRHYPNSSHHQPERSPTAPWSFIRARLEASITYIKDNIQPELRQSSSALVYVGMALGMLSRSAAPKKFSLLENKVAADDAAMVMQQRPSSQ